MKALGSSVRTPSSPGVSGVRNGWLFAAASRAVLIVEQTSGLVVEANPAAASLLHAERINLIGAPVSQAFAQSSAKAWNQSVATALASGYGKKVRLRTRRASAELAVTLSVVRAGSDSYLLVRLAAVANGGQQRATEQVSSIVLDMIEDSSEGFVLTDLGLRVSYANPAFVTLAQVDSVHDLLGRSFAQWLELTQIDLTRLREQRSLREATEIWRTMLRRASGSHTSVEITAVAVPDGEDACWGFRVTPLAASTVVHTQPADL